VASTLAIAALFNPLHCMVRALVDRRFYRRKYGAAKTLATFNSKLREKTNLDSLSDEVLGVVRETMQPAHASLWIHPHAADEKDYVPVWPSEDLPDGLSYHRDRRLPPRFVQETGLNSTATAQLEGDVLCRVCMP